MCQCLLIGKCSCLLNSPSQSAPAMCLLIPLPGSFLLSSLLSLPPLLASFLPCHCSAVELGSGKNIGFGVQQIWGQVPASPLTVILGSLPHLYNLLFICKVGTDTIKHLAYTFSRSILCCSLCTFIISLPDEFSPCSVSRSYKDLTPHQDWPKDTIVKW